jgi:poly-gamma-glutamate capsule biosynthesis protein CapA/YwtB (metallophosphatase superfamily)
VAPIPKTFSFRCDPAAMSAARRSGVEVANLANNHGYDQGPDGLLDSIRNVRRAGIVPVGAGATAERRTPAYAVGMADRMGHREVLGRSAGSRSATARTAVGRLRARRAWRAIADLVLVTWASARHSPGTSRSRRRAG